MQGHQYFLIRHIENTFKQYGFNLVSVESGTIKKQQAIFKTIKLDPDGFSTIKTIQTNTLSPLPIPGKQIVIDDLILTGEMDRMFRPTLAGWDYQPTAPLPDIKQLTLNNGRLDLNTPFGILSLKAKGQITQQEDGSQKIQAALWGKQHQLTLDTRWNVNLQPGQSWSAETEINDARLNLGFLKASRINGWLSFEKKQKNETLISVAGGQLSIGYINFASTSLNNITLTADSSLNSVHVILHAKISSPGSDLNDMLLTADFKQIKNEPFLQASVEAKNFDSLLNFLKTLHNDFQKTQNASSLLTTLLITPGNMERLRKDIAQINHDVLELQISGPLYDLSGKIIAKKLRKGSWQSHVISMDPGFNAPVR